MKRIRRFLLIYIYAISFCGTNAMSQIVAISNGIQWQDGLHSLSVSAETQTEQYSYVKVYLNLHLDSLQLRKMESRKFTPVLSDGENELVLRSITVNSRWRHLMYLRGLNEKKEDAYVILQGSRQSEIVEYIDSCLYRPWMKNAKLWLAEDLCGCGGEPMEQSLRLLADRVHVTDNVKEATFIVSQKEQVPGPAKEKVGYEVAKVVLYLDYLNFPINRMDILPDFGNNRNELQKLETALDSLLSLPNHSIELVEMTGYASPDGPYSRNDELAYGRTLALRDYLQKITRYRELPFRTASVAEDWEGLKLALENSDMPYKEELLMIIGTELPPDKKEENMKKLDEGKAYPILKQNFLPQLRRTICEIHYINKSK